MIGLAVSATMARADGISDVTDNDRMWANFTREAATVGDRHFWIELQAMKLNNDQEISQPDVTDPTKNVEGPTLGLNGYPVKPFAEKHGSNVTSIDGGTFDLVGAYGIESWEVGGNLPVRHATADLVRHRAASRKTPTSATWCSTASSSAAGRPLGGRRSAWR